MTVVCINDSNLPEGAVLNKWEEYEVEREYLNALDQRVYILKNHINEGHTKLGMRWIGYNANRFRKPEDIYAEEEKEVNYILN
jgi:hypothetical protein